MNGAKQAGWLFTLLLTLAASGWYFAKGAEPYHLDKLSLDNTPDMFVSRLSVRLFDKQGRVVNQMDAPGLVHVPKDDRYTVELPKVKIEQNEGEFWHINSQRAQFASSLEEIQFIEKVRIVQNQSEKVQHDSVIQTESLTYYPKLKKALTKDLISFEQPGMRVLSKGMVAWLDKKEVKLLSQARGHYAPATG